MLTGKGLELGGSLIRPEATGYGAVYFAEEMLATRGESLEGKDCLVSGVGQRRAVHGREAARPRREAHHPERLRRVRLRQGRHRPREARVGDGPEERPARPDHGVRRAVPQRGVHARRSEPLLQPAVGGPRRLRVPERDAERDQRRGRRQPARRRRLRRRARARTCRPCPRASSGSSRRGILYGPGKAANAGGVAVSGLEMSQNSERRGVDPRDGRRPSAHDHGVDPRELPRPPPRSTRCPGNYVHGANIAGFRKVADAMLDQGIV